MTSQISTGWWRQARLPHTRPIVSSGLREPCFNGKIANLPIFAMTVLVVDLTSGAHLEGHPRSQRIDEAVCRTWADPGTKHVKIGPDQHCIGAQRVEPPGEGA